MNPSLSDPNNHAPELAPGDDWGDAEGAVPQSATILPPRRVAADRAAVTAESVAEMGLRIESNITRAEPSDLPSQLEVQEIGSGIVRLEKEDASRKKIDRQYVFKERDAQQEGANPSQRETAAWGGAKGHPILWMLISGVVIIAIVTLSFVLLPSINASNKERGGGGNVVSTVEREDEIEGAAAMAQIIAQQPEAMQIFRSYATAMRWDEVVSLMRHDQARDESLRSSWKPLNISKSWSPDSNCTWTADRLGKDFFGMLGGELPDHTAFLAYFVRADNHLLLDWKATTGYGTATFEQLAKGEGDPREIRGKISPVEFYTATWPEADYQSYRFIAPDGIASVWCYARRNEIANAKIAPLFNQGEIVQESKDSLPITLRLQRGPGDAPPNQWSIGEVHFQGWVKP